MPSAPQATAATGPSLTASSRAASERTPKKIVSAQATSKSHIA
jgi:hypothetical protein